MRILTLSNHYPPFTMGSYEIQCMQMVQLLQRRGHNVRVLTAEAPPDTTSTFSQEGIIRRGFRLYDHTHKDRRLFYPLFRIVRYNVRILEEEISTFRPEIIAFWGMDRLPVALAITAERSGISCLYAILDHWLSDARENDPWLRYWSKDDIGPPPLVRTLLRTLRLVNTVCQHAPCGDIDELKLENVFFCSEALKHETSRHTRLALDKAAIVPCGISSSEVRRKAGGDAFTPRRLLWAARLSEEKDPLTAIKALQELLRRGYSQYTLDISGRGDPDYEATLHEYVRHYRLSHAVSFRTLSDEQLRNNIYQYDILLFTSRYPEPFPLIHLKAMAARVPVVSTLDGGSGELIRHRENGLAFKTASYVDLADKIIEVSNDPTMRESIIENAYQQVNSDFSLERIAVRIESLIYRAAEKRILAVPSANSSTAT